MLKCGEPNPLAVANIRKMDFCPPHFQKFNFDLRVVEKTILDWLHENTEGRFYTGQSVNDSGKLSYCIGFENHSEASYFAMFLNQINTFKSDF
jgi:hypothetical protein